MKKIFFSLLAVAALASCAKTEAVYTEGQSEIKIAPVASMATKANVTGVIDGTTYPTDEDFKVYAYWAQEPAGSTFEADQTGAGAYLNDVTFVNKGKYWGGENTQYWPKNGSLRFAAYSPASLHMDHVLATDVYTANVEYTANTAETYEIMVAPTSKSYTAQTAAEKVSVVFEHALSWVTFQLKSTETANNAFTVKSIVLDGVNINGTLVAEMQAGTKTWTTSNAQNVTVYTGARYVNTSEVVFEDVEKGLMVLPQQPTTVTINFTQNAIGDAPALENQSVTLPLVLTENEPWEAGKHYTYTVIFDLDEILINPSVEDWEEVNDIPAIDATATEVSTSEELVEAVAAGRSVRLAENIELTETIVVDPAAYATRSAAAVEVVLDLNGKTIKNTDAKKDVIVVKEGAKLTINGEGNVEAISGADGFTVISEGELVINGGTFKSGIDQNNEPNAVIYARGNGKVFVNGGYFPNDLTSKFVLNKKDADRATTVIEVKGGTFVNFDPANNAAETVPTNFVADGYASYELQPNVWTVLPATTAVEVENEAALRSAVNNGGEVVLANNIELSSTLLVPSTVVLDLNGYNLTVVNDSDELGVGDGIIVMENGDLTINGEGTVTANTRVVWVRKENAKATINGGHYVGSVLPSSEVIYASGANSKVTINGGKFEAVNIDDNSFAQPQFAVLNLNGNGKNGCDIKVYGGSFKGFNPNDNISENPKYEFAKGLNVVCSEGWYTVSAYTANVVLAADATVSATYNVENAVLNGAGYTFAATEGTAAMLTASTLRLINVVGDATIKNVTIDGNNAAYEGYGIRGIFATKAGVVNIDNVTIKNVTYTINDDSAVKTLNVTNSTLEGWTSYNPGTTASFNNVKFTCGTQKTFRPHGATVLKNCAFAEGFVINLDKLQGEIVFEGCSYAGRALTAADLQNAADKNVTIK